MKEVPLDQGEHDYVSSLFGGRHGGILIEFPMNTLEWLLWLSSAAFQSSEANALTVCRFCYGVLIGL